MKRLWMAAAIGCLLAPAAQAIDLLGAYDQALKTDPTRLAADEAVLAGREKAVQARAVLRPQLALSAGATRLHDETSAELPAAASALVQPSSAGSIYQAALKAKQPLWDAGAAADSRQLREQAALAEVRWRDAQQSLMQRVGEAYFELLLAQERVSVVAAEKTAVQMQRDRAQARFDVGRGRITELQEAQARLDGVIAKEVSARSTLAQKQAQFEETTGAPAADLAALRSGFVPEAPLPDDLAAWQARAGDSATRVLTKRREVAIAAHEIDRYRLAGRPTLEVVASYTYKAGSGNLSPLTAPDSNRNASIGLQFAVPLYAGGGIDSRERESLAKHRQTERELAAAQRDARLQVQDAYLSVKTGVARIAALEQSTASARTALEATALGRDVGNRTELDVLDAQQRLYAAQLDLAQARTDYLVGRVRMGAAAGDLNEGDLRALNGYLQRP